MPSYHHALLTPSWTTKHLARLSRFSWRVWPESLRLPFLCASHPHGPQHRHCQHEPETRRPLWVNHFRLFPPPSPPLLIFEPVFGPKPHLVPAHLCFLHWQVRHHRQFPFVSCFPRSQQGSDLPLAFLTPRSREAYLPSSPCHDLPDRAEGFCAFCPKPHLLIHPHHRVPVVLLDRFKQPGRVETIFP